MLKKAVINLTPSMVSEFVKITSKCDFDIDVAGNNRYFVDAKSILGILGLDLSHPLTLTYSGYDPSLESYIKSHAMAC